MHLYPLYIGFIKTDMTRKTASETLLSAIPLRRFGEPEEVAEVAVFLAKTPYITGQVII